jgi:hypothetical protein
LYIYFSNNFITFSFFFQDDCVGTADGAAAKSWNTGSTAAPEQDGGWTTYLVPMALAALAAFIYRAYFT